MVPFRRVVVDVFFGLISAIDSRLWHFIRKKLKKTENLGNSSAILRILIVRASKKRHNNGLKRIIFFILKRLSQSL
jgi:hypothetical protein